MGEPRRGRKVVVTGDTAPCEMTRVAAHEAELLVHDGSFADEELERAAETGHSTARQAAELAREAAVKLLTLVHVSSRYDVRDVLAQAREAFSATEAPRDFDLVEIPFPERGEPRLVENGARATAPAQSLAERGGEIGDRLGHGDRLVLLEEVLGRQEDRVLHPQRLLNDLQLIEPKRRILLAPDHPRGVGALREPIPQEPLLFRGQLEAAHDLRNARPRSTRFSR